MAITINHGVAKAPRWVNTEAGNWAWSTDAEWRRHADKALSVQDRRQLLDDAERRHEHPLPAAPASEADALA